MTLFEVVCVVFAFKLFYPLFTLRQRALVTKDGQGQVANSLFTNISTPMELRYPPLKLTWHPSNCFVLGQNFHDGTVQVGLPIYFLLVQFFTQTPQGTWGQKVTALQFWALSGHVLPHYKSSKVGHFKATQANIGQLRSFCNVARYAPMIIKVRVFSPFDPKTCEEFEAFGQIIFEQAYCTVKCQYFLKCPVF